MSATQPLPEYPRPQLVRSSWGNLNGPWDYAIRDTADAVPASFDGKILVPFPVESRLSGVTRPVSPAQRVWYRRSFEAPRLTSGSRLLLHFGAVDWQTEVWVNGTPVATHAGGYDPFTADITTALIPGSGQELVVGVWDPTDQGNQPRGKQVLKPHGIWYTAVTGIWQTVWLEVVPTVYLTQIEAVTVDIGSGRVRLKLTAVDGTQSTVARAVVRAGEAVVARGQGTLGAGIDVQISRARLWSPNDPFLYRATITLDGGDRVETYFGIRKIEVAPDSRGQLRLVLNGKALFELGPLDQGWWPDGLYTAPTDAALRSDIEATKRLGMNLIRKHVKVEPDRWYYWCDRLGMLVWQDMPSGNNETAESRASFERELARVVAARRAHPSVVMWVPFNEGWGQHDTERYVELLQRWDSTRLVNNTSGWTDRGVGSVSDIHAYPGPAIPAADRRRALVLGEFGGLGLPLEGHTWLGHDNWGYQSFGNRDSLWTRYRSLLGQVRVLQGLGLAAAVYTQTTDVESEVNGLLTYDRAVTKLPPAASQAALALHRAPPTVSLIGSTADSGMSEWRYTTTQPEPNWFASAFDANAWATGVAGFGAGDVPRATIRTPWTTGGIWLRRELTLERQPVNPWLALRHTDSAAVYLNGVLVGRYPHGLDSYVPIEILAAAKATIRRGKNLLAIHVWTSDHNRFVDAGLYDVR